MLNLYNVLYIRQFRKPQTLALTSCFSVTASDFSLMREGSRYTCEWQYYEVILDTYKLQLYTYLTLARINFINLKVTYAF